AACPVVKLPDSWDKYLQSLSSNFRSQVRRSKKRIETTESLRFRSLDPSEAETFAHELIRLNRTRMSDKGEVSSLEDGAFREFLVSVIPAIALAGFAWMDVLERDEQVVGAALNLAHGRSIYYYMGGFDESAKNLRPGTALFARVLERGIEKGYSSYDFLRGAEPYKYRWGATDTPTFNISIYPQEFIRGRLAFRFDSLLNGGRTLFRRLRKKAGRFRARG
ncbi:MAG: GNAT family N-acetyltransferase, partial [Woeseiaceae bacterium]